MPDARYLRAKAQGYVDLAGRTGGWEASALRALAAERISDAEKLDESARKDAVLTNDDAASQEERKQRRPASRSHEQV